MWHVAPEMPRLGKPIARVIAASSALSRRLAEHAVVSGRVAVDGAVCRTPALRVEREAHQITLDGIEIGPAIEEIEGGVRLWRYHKPRGLVTTHSDPHGRPTVFGQLPRHLPRVISVGRLDAESEGLLLLTTLGSLARSLELPSSSIERAYNCLIQTGERHVSTDMLAELSAGLTLADGTKLRPMQVEPVHGDGSAARGRRWLRMTLTEGKNREIRRVWSHFGFSTLALIRVAFGPFELGDLTPGGLQEVAKKDVEALRRKASTWPDEQGKVHSGVARKG